MVSRSDQNGIAQYSEELCSCYLLHIKLTEPENHHFFSFRKNVCGGAFFMSFFLVLVIFPARSAGKSFREVLPSNLVESKCRENEIFAEIRNKCKQQFYK